MNPLAEDGRKLFEYLAALQKSRETPVEKTKEYERSGGVVLPLHSLSDFIADSKIVAGSEIQEAYRKTGAFGSPSEDDPSLVVEFNRVNTPKFPAIPSLVKPWIVEEPETAKISTIRNDLIERNDLVIDFDEEEPHIRQAVETWIDEWKTWARDNEYVQEYDKAFELNAIATENADEFELVLGLGNLRWQTATTDLDRHIFTVPLTINRESNTGKIRVEVLDPILRLESESIPMEEVADSTFVNRVREALEGIQDEILLEKTFKNVANTTALSLTTRGEYSPVFNKADASSISLDTPQLSWSPTIILRKRGKAGLSQIFSEIAFKIAESEIVPDGLAALIDPNSAVNTVDEPTPGGVFEVENEIYSPLPLNQRQIEVLRRVDNYNQTIVQGPPGTGKTHMAAALLSHLLAQGKRVLVTAEKERALYELRDKLPAEIRELAVSVIGTQSAEQIELQNAISVIDSRASNFSPDASLSQINKHKNNLERFREESIRLRRQWYSQLEIENSPVEIEGYGKNLAEAVLEWKKGTKQLDWIVDYPVTDIHQEFPLSPGEVDELFAIHLQLKSFSLSDIFSASDIEFNQLGTPEEFLSAVATHADISRAINQLDDTSVSTNAKIWAELSNEDKLEISEAANRLQYLDEQLYVVEPQWCREVVRDLESGKADLWLNTLDELETSIANAKVAEEYVAQFRKIEVEGNYARFIHNARELFTLVKSSGPLKTNASGKPKIGLLTKKLIKESGEFFDSVLVDGVPPTNQQTINAYIAYVNLKLELEKLAEVWPYAPDDNGQRSAKRIQEFESDAALLWSLVQYSEERSILTAGLSSYELVHDDDLPFYELVRKSEEYIERITEYNDAEEHISTFKMHLESRVLGGNNSGWLTKLNAAVDGLDPQNYEAAYRLYVAMKEKGELARTYQNYLERIQSWSPTIYNELIENEFSSTWKTRVAQGEDARRWLAAKQKIESHTSSDFHALQGKLSELDKEITREISSLAERRAWHQALSSNRIDANMRKTLKSYTQAVKRLGKGTGKNAERRRREVRRHLNNCRDAVPVWIMPISRVIEQFTVEENMFDVVIVDEASQAGMDAVFLQYVAKKIVVIGDDQQVSPSAVGVKEDDIRKLANQYIRDFDDRDAWTDPRRSLFDEADMRYGGRIVLNEHRRCAPEIIEFSNELTYRPNKIELLPVREVENGRLSPFKITQTPNAPASGTAAKKINRQEANVLIAKLMACIHDPAYDGKTFGVISLLSSKAQIDYLRARLNDVIDPNDWNERDLRIGNPADFQGSERDVIFLSMVESGDPEARRSSLTGQTYIQRYNVAVSRAKDQVQLFHSVGVDALHNPDDVRHKLLTYAYRVALSAPEIHGSDLVSNDLRDDRFDSLFEQRVYNRIAARGYAVQPQFKALHYNIDLVVEGNGRRLAIECDGDYWHSAPEDVESDRRRQSALERAGWKFVRIFESDFYLDEIEQMDRVWQELNALRIGPGHTSASDVASANNIEVIESVSEWLQAHGIEEGTPLLPAISAS